MQSFGFALFLYFQLTSGFVLRINVVLNVKFTSRDASLCLCIFIILTQPGSVNILISYVTMFISILSVTLA